MQSAIMTEKRGASGDYAVSVARTPDEIASVREAWETLEGQALATDPETFFDAIRKDPRAMPYLVLLEQGGEAKAMLVAYARDLRFACKLGFTNVHTPPVWGVTAVTGGTLGEWSAETSDVLLQELRRAVDRGETEAVHLARIPVDSELYRAARTRAPFAVGHARKPLARWELALPVSHEEYVRSRSPKTRRGIRNYANRLERDFADAVTVRVFRERADLDELVREVGRAVERSWQGDVGVGLRLGEDEIRRIARSLERGRFRAYVLSLDDRPVAYWTGEVSGGRLHATATGYDPEYGHYSIGRYLLMRMVEDLCADPAVSVLDFGLGDAEYKTHYGTRRWEERDLVLFGSRPRALAVAMLLKVADSTLAGLDALLRIPRVKRALKRLWLAAARLARRRAPS